MKRRFAWLLLLALLVCCTACGKETSGSKEEQTLPGEIAVRDRHGYEKYTAYWLTYDGNELRIGTVDGSYRLLRCDSAGRLIEETEYTANGKKNYSTAYTYDKDGNLTEKRKQTRGSVYRDVYTYDGRGNRLSWEYGYDGESAEREEYTYDENGNETARASYEADGTCSSREESAYDEKGNLTATVSYDADGTVLSRNEYTYDAQGRMHAWIRYHGDTVWFHQEFVYDEAGNLLQILEGEETGDSGVIEAYAYDAQGQMVESISYDADGVPTVRHTYAYDGRGNQTEEAVFYSEDTLVSRYLYTYDENGYPTGHTIHSVDGGEKVQWQVTETVTATASEVQTAFYRYCIETYVLPTYVR